MMNSGLDVPIYKDTMDCIRKINTEEGTAAFFKGNMSNMIRSISSSLVLILFDEFQSAYLKRNKTH